MGIYFGVFNVDKREWFSGHDLESGAKWWETTNGPPAVALLTLLKVMDTKDGWTGRWAGDRIVVRGDYGLDWGEVLEEIEIRHYGHPSWSWENEEEGPWKNIGEELFPFLVAEGALPCERVVKPENGYCSRCDWPVDHHGKLLGVVLRKSSL